MASEPEVNGAPTNGSAGKIAKIAAITSDNVRENRLEESRKRCIFMYQALVGYSVKIQVT